MSSSAHQGEMINSFSGTNMNHFQIFDNESPSFSKIQEKVVYIKCNEEIPSLYFMAAEDNCIDKECIDQEVWDEYLDYNEYCSAFNVRRYWKITDYCENSTFDTLDYRYSSNPRLSNLNYAQDIVEASNIFSPNGDENNDYFTIYLGNVDVAASEFYLFDRIGNLRYEEMNLIGERIETKLGGDLSNKSWATGIYVWMLKITDSLGKTKVVSGEVTLLL